MTDLGLAIIGVALAGVGLLFFILILARLKRSVDADLEQPPLCTICWSPMVGYKGQWHCGRCNEYCVGCGYVFARGEKTCPNCGMQLPEKDAPKAPEIASDKRACGSCGAAKVLIGRFWHCPRCESFCEECGYVVGDDAAECPNCRVKFETGDAEEQSPEHERPVIALRCKKCGSHKEKHGKFFHCPKCESYCEECGYVVADDEKQCANCGSEFETGEGLPEEDMTCGICGGQKEMWRGFPHCPKCESYCEECGCVVSDDATECANCGSEFETAEEAAPPTCGRCGQPKEKYKDYWHCPDCESYCEECGFAVDDDAAECPNCWAEFEAKAGSEPEPGPEKPGTRPKCGICGGLRERYKRFWHCPRCDSCCEECGYVVADDATQCPNCKCLF